MKNFTFEQICFVTIVNLHVQYFREFNSPSRKILKFDFRPYSAFIFGGRNRRPNSENFRFRPQISASGIPLQKIYFFFKTTIYHCQKEIGDLWIIHGISTNLKILNKLFIVSKKIWFLKKKSPVVVLVAVGSSVVWPSIFLDIVSIVAVMTVYKGF